MPRPIPPTPAARVAARHPAIRIAQLAAGMLLMIAAPLASPLPGPGGILLFAGGLVLVLRNSAWARVRFVRLKRRWPRTGRLVDRAMRRQSALRRHARDRARKDAARAMAATRLDGTGPGAGLAPD